MADDLVNPLIRKIQERLPWLFAEYGFKIIDYSYDARSFGNCIVTLESEYMRLRFTRDRGFSFAELASKAEPEYWFDPLLLLLPVFGERPDAGFEGTAMLLRDNFPALVQALGPKFPETKREEERRRQSVLGRWAHKSVPINFSYTAASTRLKQKVVAIGVYVLLRVLEGGIVLWALYTIFNRR